MQIVHSSVKWNIRAVYYWSKSVQQTTFFLRLPLIVVRLSPDCRQIILNSMHKIKKENDCFGMWYLMQPLELGNIFFEKKTMQIVHISTKRYIRGVYHTDRTLSYTIHFSSQITFNCYTITPDSVSLLLIVTPDCRQVFHDCCQFTPDCRQIIRDCY